MINNIVEISTDNKELSLYRGFLRIKESGNILKDVPIDSFSSLIISGHGIILTSNLLSSLAEYDIPVVIVGKNYHPNGIFVSLIGQQKQQEIQNIQIKMSLPLQKKLWATIVKEKIKNQSNVLDLLNKQNPLKYISERVLSGDSSNQEAFAAKLYFPILFGNKFIRNPAHAGINSFLNYGYAILRATLARKIVAAGLNTSFGINHHNKLNPFCLVDDLMEPYRPLVDIMVYDIFQGKENINKELNSMYKKQLCSLIEFNIKTSNGESPLNMLIQKDIWAFVNSIKEKKILLNYNQMMVKNVFQINRDKINVDDGYV